MGERENAHGACQCVVSRGVDQVKGLLVVLILIEEYLDYKYQ
jgi:hypothetical protein